MHKNDTVAKKEKNKAYKSHNSFDVNNRKINYEAMLAKIKILFRLDESGDITKNRIIESSNKANKVDEYMKYFNDKNFELVSDRMKRIIKRNELYKKEMLLYKKLCEELIKLSDVSDLDKISSIVNDTISFPKANEIFLNEIKDIINEKYISASSTQKKNKGGKHKIKYN